MRISIPILVLVIISGILILASCSEEVDPTATPRDVTTPTVLDFHPANGAEWVPVDEIIRVTFSEDMDTNNWEGNYKLPECTESYPSWVDRSHLEVHHSDWPQGVGVCFMVFDGWDLAGNSIDSTLIVCFKTVLPELRFLRSEPDSAAQNVSVHSSVMMLFSAPVDNASLEAVTSVTAIPPIKTDIEFTIGFVPDNWVEMTFAELLPEDTDILVTIAPGAESWYGHRMEQSVEFWFRTGSSQDLDPPRIISILPESGSVLTPGTFIEVILSESVDPSSMDVPIRLNAELLLAALEYGITSEWEYDYKSFKIPLPADLPAGLPIDMTFCYYADLAGNVQTTPYHYTATMAGTPDYCPLVDGVSYERLGHWMGGEAGNPVPTQEYWWTEYMVVEGQGDGVFHLKEFKDEAHTVPDDWNILHLTESALLLAGQHEDENDGHTEWTLDPPAVYLPFPVKEESWLGSYTFSSSNGITLESEYVGTVIGQENLPIEPFSQPGRKTEIEEVFWKDCWKVAVSHQFDMDGVAMVTNDTIWYAPTIGRVLFHRLEGGVSEGEWGWTETYRVVHVPD